MMDYLKIIKDERIQITPIVSGFNVVMWAASRREDIGYKSQLDLGGWVESKIAVGRTLEATIDNLINGIFMATTDKNGYLIASESNPEKSIGRLLYKKIVW